MPVTCPSREELLQFYEGRLDEQSVSQVASHVDSCAECQGLLQTAVGGGRDTILSALQHPPAENAFADEAACREAIARVEALAGDRSAGHEATIAPADSGLISSGPSGSATGVTVSLPAPAAAMIREYKLLAKLGEGGMGAVYKALHTRLDKTVALKVLPADRMRDTAAVARFQREMKAVGRLEHPNIVRAMDAGEADGMHYLVMEYVPGVDLSDISRRVGPLPLADACELVRQAALGLQEAHEHGMVHRDIKPSNLILAQPRRKQEVPSVKILDLGLALLSEAFSPDQPGLTSTGQMMGTLDYMAPEQGGDSHQVDIRADVYSLGATLYKLLCGEAPFGAAKYDTPVKKLVALATQEPLPLVERRSDVPAELSAIVQKMLAKEPSQRFSTPEEVADALAPFCAGADLAAVLAAGSGGAIADVPKFSDTRAHLTSASVETATKDKRQVPAAQRSVWAAFRCLPPRARALALAGAGGLALVACLGVIFFLQTPNGTVRIEINDPAIRVVLDKGGATFQGVDKDHKIKLQSGPHGLTITRGDLTFDTDMFELKKGETTRLLVQYLPGKVQVTDASGKLLGSGQLPHVGKPAAQAIANASSAGDSSAVAAANYELDLSAAPGAIPPAVILPESFSPEGSFTIEMFATPGVIADRLGQMLFVRGDSGPDARVTIYFKQWGNNWHWELRAKGQTTELDGAIAKNSVQPGHRTHLAGVWTPEELRLYVDGQLAATAPASGSFRNASGQCMIGLNTAWPNFLPFAGTVDEIRFSTIARYDENFTPAERLSPDEETWALYHCDDRGGLVLRDASANRRHGQVIGAKWVKLGGQSVGPSVPPRAIAPFDAAQAKAHQTAWAKYLGLPVEYTNQIGMKFRLIPPGEFLMGSPPGDIEVLLKTLPESDSFNRGCLASEGPQHKVILTQPFYLATCEVTQEQYASVQGVNPAYFAKDGANPELAKRVAQLDTSRHPVEGVIWTDAEAFVKKLGGGYRLPTEAEWEFACRAGSTTRYNHGEQEEGLSAIAWWSKNSGNRPHPVGELQANPFGLHDVAGGVWEWVSDAFEPSYFASLAAAPAIDPQGPAFDKQRVIRGGSWYNSAFRCRAPSRIGAIANDRVFDVGIRVALSVEAVKDAQGKISGVDPSNPSPE